MNTVEQEIAYCVEQPTLRDGSRVGTLRFWTPSRARAEEQVAEGHGRTMRIVEGDEIPEKVRDGMRAAKKDL